MRVAIFTTAHPLDDVRAYSKFAKSFREIGGRINWIGPRITAFESNTFRDPHITYHLYRIPGGKAGRILSIPRAAISLARFRGADWLYCPDPDSASLAVILRPLHGARVIFDVHEEYHTDLLSRWVGQRFSAMAAKALTFLLRRVVSGTTILVGVNDTVLLPYRRAARTSLVVRNSAPDWFASHETGARKEHPRVRFFHGKATGTGGTLPVLEALTKVDEQVEVLTFPSAGGVDGTPYLPDLQKQIDRLGVREQLVLSESVPHTGMPELMDSCDVGMIGYGRELGRASLPNRLFEYMARGLPVLAPGYSPLIKAILEEHKAGITCDFEDPDSIAEAMSWFATHPEEARQMGRRARAAFDKHYSWAAEFAALAGAMRSTEAH